MIVGMSVSMHGPFHGYNILNEQCNIKGYIVIGCSTH